MMGYIGSPQKRVRRQIENKDNDAQIKSTSLSLTYVTCQYPEAVLLIIRQLHLIKRIEDKA